MPERTVFSMSRMPTVLLAVASTLLLIAGCGGGDDDGINTPPPAGVERVGSLSDLPSGTILSDVEIVAGLDSSAVDASGGFRISIGDTNCVQAVFALNADDRPIHFSLYSPLAGTPLALSARETAFSLVLMHPLLMPTDQDLATRARELIAGLDHFDALVTVLDNEISHGYLIGDSNPQVELALGSVYVDYIEALSVLAEANLHTKDLGPFNGLTVIGPEYGASDVSFSVRNRLKRWIALYSAPVAADGSVGNFTFHELMVSPNVSLLRLVFEGLGSLTEESETYRVSTADAAAIELRCYGLGTAIDLNADDFERMIEPMACSVVFDIGIPVAEVLAGQDLGLRGRPRDHALYRYVGQSLVHCPNLQAELWAGIRNQQMPDVIIPLVECFINQAASEPRVFADVIQQIIMDRLGIDVARRVLTSWLWPVRLVNALVTGANLGWTLASVVSSEATTAFNLDVGDPASTVSTIYGDVSDVETGDPIAGATIALAYVDGSTIAATLTDANGDFSLGVPAGSLSVAYSHSRYHSVIQIIEVPEGAPTTIYLPTTLLATPSSATGAFEGEIINAASGGVVAGALVELRRGFGVPDAELIATVTSGSNGAYVFTAIPTGSYTATAMKSGFISQSIYVTVAAGTTLSNKDITISPVLGDALRFVLTWGSYPTDLDSHLSTPSIGGSVHHVRWSSRGSLVGPPYALLDVDDTTSWGPETITIAQTVPGIYRYAIYRWSAGELVTSQAHVVLYSGSTVIREWNVPRVGSGRWWYICDFDIENGDLVERNVLQDTAPPGMAPSKSDLKEKPTRAGATASAASR